MKLLLILFICFHRSYAQFGEIASVISSLVAGPASSLIGSGAAAGGLAGLAGTAGSAGAAGAAGALGNLGSLYQLAQSALQLTGTGVGILNQASESSWFPAAVESVAKANKDFQDRLLAGTSGQGGGTGIIQPLVPPGGGGGGGIGTEYGKNFGGGTDGTDETEETSFTDNGIVEWTPEPTTEEWTPEPTHLTPRSSYENKETTTEASPDYYETKVNFKVPSQGKLSTGDLELIKPISIESKPIEKKDPVVTFSSFSIDEKPLISKEESEESELIPTDDVKDLSKNPMTPKLHRLIQELKHSHLTKEEFLELAKQLEENKNAGEPRENSTPVPEVTTTEDPDDSMPITDEEMREAEEKMKEAEKRLNESIRHLHESLKPRQFEAPILIVKPSNVRVQPSNLVSPALATIVSTPSPTPAPTPVRPLINRGAFAQPVSISVMNQLASNTFPPPPYTILRQTTGPPPVPILVTSKPRFMPIVPLNAHQHVQQPQPVRWPNVQTSNNFPIRPQNQPRAYVVTPRTLVDSDRSRTFQTSRPYANSKSPPIVRRRYVHDNFSPQQRPSANFAAAPMQRSVYQTNTVRTQPVFSQPQVVAHDVRTYQPSKIQPYQPQRIITSNFNRLPSIVPSNQPAQIVQQVRSPYPQGYRIPPVKPNFYGYNRVVATTQVPIASRMPYQYQYQTGRWN